MIKKIIALLLIAIFSFSSAFAYTSTELEAKKMTYKKVIKSKFADKLEKIPEAKLKKILVLIDKFVIKYKNSTKISDAKKLKKIALLLAFKEIISEKLENEYSDINTILGEANKNYGPIFIISDTRCGDKCNTKAIISQLKEVKGLEDANYIKLDFSKEQAKNLLKTSGIKKLPAVIFPDNNVDKNLKLYLEKTNNKSYTLNVGASFDPYQERSKKGFQILDKQIIESIKRSSYIKGNRNSEILWLEYSDMECPYCAKLHNSGTKEELNKKYGTKLSYSLQHFPLGFHKNALPAAEALECMAKQKGEKAYFELENIVFTAKNSNLDFVIESAVKLGANKTKLEKCVENKEFSEKISFQQKQGTELFGITGTPGNVLINTKTGEYEVVSGAYPTSYFIETIDKLLK